MTSRIKLTIRPSGGEKNEVVASDFLKQVSALRDLVILSVHATADVEARVVGLSHSSPATVELDAVWRSDYAPVQMDDYFNAVRDVIEKGEAPRELGRPVFDALKEFASVIGKGVSEATLQFGDQKIVVEHQARQRIEAVIEPDYLSEGAIDGMLEAVNIHGNRNQFVLYPVVGPLRVNCFFPDEMLDQVKPALGKYALVTGQLKYKWREKFPFETRASRVEVLSEDDQPSFQDIAGIAPGATKGMASEEFVRDIRSGRH